MDTKRIIAEIRPSALYALFYPFKYLFWAILVLVASFFAKPYIDQQILQYITIALVIFSLLGYCLSYLFIRSIRYQLTEEQILYTRGIFTVTTDYIELYRIVDFTVIRSFLLRIIGGMTFSMDTIDKSHPVFKLEGIPKSNIDLTVRDLVERNRARKRVLVTE